MPSSFGRSSHFLSPKRASFALRALTAAALGLCLALGSSTFAEVAYADVRKSDLLHGETMGERGVRATSSPNLGSEFVYVCSADGEEYFARNADEETQIASITKVMTAIVALEHGDLSQKVTVTKDAATVGESSANLQEGDVLTLENALKGLMVPSGNDAAIAIADCLGTEFQKQARADGAALHRADGSAIDYDDPASAVDAFVAKMNEKAAELGCEHTVFDNPHGLDSDRFAGNLHSTAREVSKICAYAMKNATFRDFVDIPYTEIPVKRGEETVMVPLETTDLLLGNFEGSCGIKTGKTDLAGPCFAGACNREGQELYAIVLKSASDEQRFIDCETLFNWVYDNDITYQLAHSPESVEMDLNGQWREVPVVAEVALTGWVDKTVKATFKDPDATVPVFALDGNVSQRFEFADVSGGVSAGQTVGEATFYQHNAEIAKAELIACEDVPGPNPIEAVGIWWDKTMRTFSGKPVSAESKIVNETPLILEKD